MRLNRFLALGLLASLAGMPLFAHASTTAPATISSDIEWTLAGSPYIVNDTVTVASGATLTIDSGVVVKVFANTSGVAAFDVLGTLNAAGSATSEIVFTSLYDSTYGGDTTGGSAATPEQSRWGTILFEGVSATSTLSHVRVRYAGISGDANSTALSIQGNGKFVGNRFTYFGSHVLFSDSTLESVPGYQFFMGSMGYADFERVNFLGENYIGRLWTSNSDASPTTVVMNESAMDGVAGLPFDYHNGVFVLSLANNWWGDINGPYDASNNPSGTVNVGHTPATVTPFLTCDPAAYLCDFQIPTITLLGDVATSTPYASVFSDPGATATDIADGDLTSLISVTGAVDTSLVGTTTLKYSVTNAHGLTASTTRTVEVQAAPIIVPPTVTDSANASSSPAPVMAPLAPIISNPPPAPITPEIVPIILPSLTPPPVPQVISSPIVSAEIKPTKTSQASSKVAIAVAKPKALEASNPVPTPPTLAVAPEPAGPIIITPTDGGVDNSAQMAAVANASSQQGSENLAAALYKWLISLWTGSVNFLAWLF